MNKNQKPPIIVDDIIVTELNLGEVPPDLEVVEISDIGVDKFRGTFKMSYMGNAFITIKTRVQANPLNTYLITRPAYASPRPLAASAGLTIPLAITLSDFKLSAIIILVFSKQKGLTIVFRNDPLESLKVSSTFDSIPFVANYLQTVIEGQLRTLFMDELPAIIHRMSLRLWVPEYKAQEERALREEQSIQDEPVIDPLASAPQDPVDPTGAELSPGDIAALSLDSHHEIHSLFSRKNLLRLATLTDSHRTLSLFTPNIQGAVFRAWTGPLERGEVTGSHSKVTTPALSRSHSYTGSISTSYTFDAGLQVRPSSSTHISSMSGMNLGGHRIKGHGNRKRKKRVVNLRKSEKPGDEDGSTVTDSTSVTGSTSDAPTVFSAPPATSSLDHMAMDPVTPPPSPRAMRALGNSADFYIDQEADTTPQARIRRQTPSHVGPQDVNNHQSNPSNPTYLGQLHRDRTIRPRHRRTVNLNRSQTEDETPKASMYLPEAGPRQPESGPATKPPMSALERSRQQPVRHSSQPSLNPPEKRSLAEGSDNPAPSSSTSSQPPALPNFLSFITDSSSSSSIAERAWMMKMAAEVARRYEDERKKGIFGSETGDQDGPPPAYAG